MTKLIFYYFNLLFPFVCVCVFVPAVACSSFWMHGHSDDYNKAKETAHKSDTWHKSEKKNTLKKGVNYYKRVSGMKTTHKKVSVTIIILVCLLLKRFERHVAWDTWVLNVRHFFQAGRRKKWEREGGLTKHCFFCVCIASKLKKIDAIVTNWWH